MHKDAVACFRCRSQAGELNNNWRGGRTYHKAGYVMVAVPNHPRATTGGSRYVFEHILAMEELLGRYLLPDESVHHINGVRDDNRPENLELWVRPQPSGIRVKDALTWARKILNRYEGEATSNNAHSID
jgi:HNH endonuclease